LKNKVGNSEKFSAVKIDRQFTTFYQQATTISPSKNHTEPLVFRKTPCKNANSPSLTKSAESHAIISRRALGP
jgi:hypothetical protein